MNVSLAHRQPAVLVDRIPGTWVRDALLVVGSAAFVGILAQIAIPLLHTPVPVTGQTFGVLLAGAALGWWRAFAGMLVYASAGAAGVPWFAEAKSGVAWPTFGYIVGFVLAATVVGWLAGRGGDRSVLRAGLTMLLGSLLIYAVGVPWLAVSIDVSFATAISLGMTPFLFGDVLKLVLAAGILPFAWKLLRT